jgi:hypothetical protein
MLLRKRCKKVKEEIVSMDSPVSWKLEKYEGYGEGMREQGMENSREKLNTRRGNGKDIKTATDGWSQGSM